MLNKTTVFWIAVSVSMLVVAISLISWVLVMGGFGQLERKFADKNILRAHEVIEDAKNNLVVKLADWTAWDDTYAFVEDRNEAYIKSNLTDTVMTNLGINMMGFFNTQGERIWFMDNSQGNKISLLPPESLSRYLIKESLLLALMEEGNFRSGILLLPEGPLFVALRPIVRSNGAGPVRGTLLFAKHINAHELKRLGDIIKVDMDLRRIEDDALPVDFKAAREMLLQEKKSVIEELDTMTIAGYMPLEDVFGKESMILKVSMPREIAQFGRNVLKYFIFSLIVVGFIFGFFVYLPLEKEISSKVRAEKLQEAVTAQLQDERKSLETIFDSTQVGLLLVNSKLQVKRLNKVVLDLGGKDLFAVMDQQPGDALSCIHAGETEQGCGGAPDCKACPVRAAGKAILATGRSVRGAIFSRRIRTEKGEEKLVWLELNASPIMIGQEDHILFSLANITERKQVEDEQLASFKFLETLIDAIPNPVFYKDINGVYLGCNKAYLDTVGKKREDIIGKTVFDIFPKDQAAAHQRMDLQLIRQQGMQTYENKFVFSNGSCGLGIFTKASFLGIDGKVAGIIGLVVDITDREKREQEDQKRVHEYEVFYKASVGREERIIELKEQVRQLQSLLENKKQV